MLFYGHYDVQPVDPLNLWHRPPFEPVVTDHADGRKIIVARGAEDDKGQLMTFVEACRAWKSVTGSLPVDITILIEGEEEIGSKNFVPFLEANKGEFKADFALVCDTGMWDPNTPAITTSLRGLVYEEVKIKAANRDLHSGVFGGGAQNPIRVLTQHSRRPVRRQRPHHHSRFLRRREGFAAGHSGAMEEAQSDAGILPQADRAFDSRRRKGSPLDRADFLASDLRHQRHHRRLYRRRLQDGDSGGSFRENFVPPGGGAGPRQRSAKPFATTSPRGLPGDCTAEFGDHSTAPAIALDWNMKPLAAAKRALTEEWGKETVLMGSGASIPIVADFKRTLGLDTVLVGFGLDDDNIHSPNEKYDLKSFHKGIRSWARILGHWRNCRGDLQDGTAPLPVRRAGSTRASIEENFLLG